MCQACSETWNVSVNQGEYSYLHRVCILVRGSQILKSKQNELKSSISSILRGCKWSKKVKQDKGNGRELGNGSGQVVLSDSRPLWALHFCSGYKEEEDTLHPRAQSDAQEEKENI